MFGRKYGFAELLKEKLHNNSIIQYVIWNCLNYRLKLAVHYTIEEMNTIKQFKALQESIQYMLFTNNLPKKLIGKIKSNCSFFKWLAKMALSTVDATYIYKHYDNEQDWPKHTAYQWCNIVTQSLCAFPLPLFLHHIQIWCLLDSPTSVASSTATASCAYANSTVYTVNFTSAVSEPTALALFLGLHPEVDNNTYMS